MTSFVATNSVFNITDKQNAFSTNIPGQWKIPSFIEDVIFDQLKNLLKLKFQADIELHVQEIRNRGDKEINSKEYTLSDFDMSRKEILEK